MPDTGGVRLASAVMAEPRGAGPAGGLLFMAVVAFLAYLALTTLLGFLRWLLGVGLIIILVVLAVRVVNRR